MSKRMYAIAKTKEWRKQMNAVEIDVSKEKNTVAIMRSFGEVVASPFDVDLTAAELDKLVCFRKINGETRIVMEYTGTL